MVTAFKTLIHNCTFGGEYHSITPNSEFSIEQVSHSVNYSVNYSINHIAAGDRFPSAAQRGD
jgi:hypothetical protein